MADLKIQGEVSLDASGLEAGVAKSKRSLADLGATAASEGKKASDGIAGIGAGGDRAAAKIEAASKNLIGSVQRSTAAMEAGKKGTADYYESIARQRNLGDALKPYIEQLRQVEARAKAASMATQELRASTSFGATSFAKPLGNVTTSLGATGFGAVAGEVSQVATVAGAIKTAGHDVEEFGFKTAGAKRELLVLAHELSQGNYSKFGGSMLVLGERTGAASLLFSAAGLAAIALVGALVAVGTAMAQGASEASAYSKAIALTGNYLGLTNDQLASMAEQIGKTNGATHTASEALSELVGSGKIAQGALGDVGTAVVAMNRVLGTEIDKAVDVFTKLAEKPAEASAKLNESTHYLTESIYEQISALEAQGRADEAAALAQTTYAQATIARLKDIEGQAGYLAKAWRVIRDDANYAWDAMQGVGRKSTTGDLLADAQKRLAYVQQNGGNQAPIQAEISGLARKSFREQENADAVGEKRRAEDLAITGAVATKKWQEQAKGVDAVNRELKKYHDQLNDIRQVNPNSGLLDPKAVAAGEEAIRKAFEGPKGAKEKAYTDDAATRMLETLKQTQASLQAQLDGEDKLTEAQKEQAKFQQQIADLKTKGILTADQKSLLAASAQINAQLEQNVAIEHQLVLKKEAAALDEKRKKDAEEFARQVEGINISIESSNRSRGEQQDRQLAAFGLGDRARQEVEAQKSIRTQFEGFQRQLTKDAAAKDQLGSDEYKKESQAIGEALDAALQSQSDYFAALKAKREDWVNGATTGLANFVDEIDNAAQRAQTLVSTTLNGLTDGITKAIMGDKGSSFKDLGKSIASQIVKGMVETQITKPIAQWLQGSLADTSGGGSGVGGLLGGIAKLFAGSGGGAVNLGTATGADLALAFSDGGYTGPGDKMQPAGIVHAGEYVMTAEATKKLGVGFLEKLNRRGYADGGLVTSLNGAGRAPAANDAGTVIHQTINFQTNDPVNRKTQDQLGLAASRGVQRAQRNA